MITQQSTVHGVGRTENLCATVCCSRESVHGSHGQDVHHCRMSNNKGQKAA